MHHWPEDNDYMQHYHVKDNLGHIIDGIQIIQYSIFN